MTTTEILLVIIIVLLVLGRENFGKLLKFIIGITILGAVIFAIVENVEFRNVVLQVIIWVAVAYGALIALSWVATGLDKLIEWIKWIKWKRDSQRIKDEKALDIAYDRFDVASDREEKALSKMQEAQNKWFEKNDLDIEIRKSLQTKYEKTKNEHKKAEEAYEEAHQVWEESINTINNAREEILYKKNT